MGHMLSTTGCNLLNANGGKYVLQFGRFTVCRWGSVQKKMQHALDPNSIPVLVMKPQHYVSTDRQQRNGIRQKT